MEQEYIKGDIVMYDNKIHTIMDALGVNNYELSYIEHPVHQLELSGVLLTPEILEKNGWEKDEEASFKTQLYYRKKVGVRTIFVIIKEASQGNYAAHIGSILPTTNVDKYYDYLKELGFRISTLYKGEHGVYVVWK